METKARKRAQVSAWGGRVFVSGASGQSGPRGASPEHAPRQPGPSNPARPTPGCQRDEQGDWLPLGDQSPKGLDPGWHGLRGGQRSAECDSAMGSHSPSASHRGGPAQSNQAEGSALGFRSHPCSSTG
eukprot:365699-Chlamydomonas_euryale.AAC.3